MDKKKQRSLLYMILGDCFAPDEAAVIVGDGLALLIGRGRPSCRMGVGAPLEVSIFLPWLQGSHDLTIFATGI